MADGGQVDDVLADRPELEDALAAILEVDEIHDTWTFDDIPVDSGAFGELVGEGVVRKSGGEYELANPDAIRAALGREESVESSSAQSDTGQSLDVQLPSIDLVGVGMLSGALLLVVLGRAFQFGRVFQNDDVVLGANDPYFYRYWVEQLVGTGASATDLPNSIANGEPLLVATLSAISTALGGMDAVGVVMALYPVVSALIVAILLYWIGMELTDDRRVALAAVVFVAFTPGHALRTALGFADHHAFDYVWLALTATALVALSAYSSRKDLQRPKAWLASGGLAIGIAGQTLAWEAGPLLILPVGFVVAGRVLLAVKAEQSVLVTTCPLLAGLAVGALLTLLGHSLGWHSFAVAITPALLAAGCLGLVVVGAVFRRSGRTARELLIAESAVGLVGVLGLFLFVPTVGTRLLSGLGLLGRTDNIAEVQPLISGETFGFLLLFGFVLVLALPMLAWASTRVPQNERLLTVCVYGWFFFGLALLQVRFVGELAMFSAFFAGLAFVWLAARVDVTSPPDLFDGESRMDWGTWTPGRPAASTVLAVLALFALAGGFGVVQTAIKVDQITTADAEYETAAATAEFAAERGWESPSESYVLSNWGDNRMFNYFVNGDSESYGYARSTYSEFVTATDPDAAADMLRSNVRFVITGRLIVRASDSIGARLHEHFGSRASGTAGLAHYRAIFASDDGSYKSFVRVPGATLAGSTTPNETITLHTSVEIPGARFTYERQVTANESGDFGVSVAYPGTYELSDGSDTWSVEVPESAVMDGETVSADP